MLAYGSYLALTFITSYVQPWINKCYEEVKEDDSPAWVWAKRSVTLMAKTCMLAIIGSVALSILNTLASMSYCANLLSKSHIDKLSRFLPKSNLTIGIALVTFGFLTGLYLEKKSKANPNI